MWTLEFEHGIAAIQRNAELADTMSRQIRIWYTRVIYTLV